MQLRYLPALTDKHFTAFNASRKFYHFSHSDYLLSAQILESSLKQYNQCIDQWRLIDETIKRTEASSGLFALVTDLNIKENIRPSY